MPNYKVGEKVKIRYFSGRVYDGFIEKDNGTSHVVVRVENKKKVVRRENIFRRKKLDGGSIVSRNLMVETDEVKFMPNPKKPPERSQTYLDFIRGKSCCSCGAVKTEPHHWAPKGRGGGMGSKCSDYRTVPLCRKCHDYWHSTGAVPTESIVGTRQLFANCQLDYLIEWIERKNEKNK